MGTIGPKWLLLYGGVSSFFSCCPLCDARSTATELKLSAICCSILWICTGDWRCGRLESLFADTLRRDPIAQSVRLIALWVFFFSFFFLYLHEGCVTVLRSFRQPSYKSVVCMCVKYIYICVCVDNRGGLRMYRDVLAFRMFVLFSRAGNEILALG